MKVFLLDGWSVVSAIETSSMMPSTTSAIQVDLEEDEEDEDEEEEEREEEQELTESVDADQEKGTTEPAVGGVDDDGGDREVANGKFVMSVCPADGWLKRFCI